MDDTSPASINIITTKIKRDIFLKFCKQIIGEHVSTVADAAMLNYMLYIIDTLPGSAEMDSIKTELIEQWNLE